MQAFPVLLHGSFPRVFRENCLTQMLYTGKTFFRKKKQPIPVDLTTRDWGRRVKDAVQATYLYRPTGNSISIKYVPVFPLPFSHTMLLRCESKNRVL